MNNLSQIVNSLDGKVLKLLREHNELKSKNAQLQLQNEDLQKQVTEQSQEINELQREFESLKIANAMVGSKEDKHITKLKINALIREIDKCIVQLSD